MPDKGFNNGSGAGKIGEENTTLWAVLLSAGAFIAGIVAFYVASLDIWGNTGQTILSELGGLLLLSAVVSMLWELGAKRRFMREILDKTGLSEKIWRLGFKDGATTFGDIGLKDYISGSSQVDILVAGGTSVISDNKEALKEIARRKDARIRLILPDPEDADTMKAMARQFRGYSRASDGSWVLESTYTQEKMVGRINDAIAEIDDVRSVAEHAEQSSGGGGVVETWLLSMPLLYTVHRCDDVVIFVPYRHRPGKDRTVLTLAFAGQSSDVYGFFMRELEWMTNEDSGCSRFYDSGGGKGAHVAK